VDIAALSHPGNGVPAREDHYLVVRAKRSLEIGVSNLSEPLLPRSFDEIAYGMLIAAGMDGMPAAELASAMAVLKLIELVVNTPDWNMRMNRRRAAIVMRRMRERFLSIDEALKQRTEEEPGLIGMSATLTVACSLGADLFVGHIGDSRAYLLHSDELHQLTRDHTLAQALIDAGIGEAENAIVRGMRRVLTGALGTARLKVEPEVQRFRLCDGDQLLVCSNGIIDAVDEATIGSILRDAGAADEACSALVETAVSGGSDSVTVLLARYRFP
jgi:protein phosphatase